MRAMALGLLLALLFPTAAAFASRTAACCCAPKGGASCPMKRKAAPSCDAKSARTCGLKRSETSTAIVPFLGYHEPFVLEPASAAATPADAGSFRAREARTDSFFLEPPDPPPPRRA